MRLLRRSSHGDLTFTDDLHDTVPAYAILSHTWGKDEEEVIFQDIENGSGRHKEGYEKIKFCGEQAARDGLQHFWVDTCCIDKTNHVELTTAINSMYRWYQNAAKCYVYLSDVTTNGEELHGSSWLPAFKRSRWHTRGWTLQKLIAPRSVEFFSSTRTTNGEEPHGSSWLPAFKRSRWHTRGWTLQELIAPRSVEFFSSTRTRLGDKRSLEKELHEISGVPGSILQGGPLLGYDVEKQLSWMDRRQTKWEEDQAYALLGLFGVYMPLIYGEGKKNALRRLNEEISKSARYKSHAENDTSAVQPTRSYFGQVPRQLRRASGLHSSLPNSKQSWEVVYEDNLPDTIEGATRPTDRWKGGTYQLCYPATHPVANILLSVDWHAFDGDPSAPLLEWRIHTPQSLYYPGTHTGRLLCERIKTPWTPRFIQVLFDSRIYHPFVRQSSDGGVNGSTSSDGQLEEMVPVNYRLDYILQSVAHFLAYGPWYDRPESDTAPFRFHEMEAQSCDDDRDALARAASFVARAYTMQIPDENDFPDTPLPEECRKTTAIAITELMKKHGIPVGDTWDFETSLKAVKTQREWALEERKWADRLWPLIFP
ncbi:HET-domain-containing protein [Decorospora gaudefroyi]|uniref:HET-domain-containing protein n=1 Tax=Decorospora gaudefroyi TaxID=184978 RepID=A0A6A5KIW1_9PLEO|nr:HET-domain-containing protein [Decorospora gaudefroyi]